MYMQDTERVVLHNVRQSIDHHECPRPSYVDGTRAISVYGFMPPEREVICTELWEVCYKATQVWTLG